MPWAARLARLRRLTEHDELRTDDALSGPAVGLWIGTSWPLHLGQHLLPQVLG